MHNRDLPSARAKALEHYRHELDLWPHQGQCPGWPRTSTARQRERAAEAVTAAIFWLKPAAAGARAPKEHQVDLAVRDLSTVRVMRN